MITVEAPTDILGTPGAIPSPPPVAIAPSILTASDGWVVVAIAGVAIVAIFVVGMLLTH